MGEPRYRPRRCRPAPARASRPATPSGPPGPAGPCAGPGRPAAPTDTCCPSATERRAAAPGGAAPVGARGAHDAQAAAIGRALQVYDLPSGPDEVREAYAQWRARGEPMPRGGDWSLAAAVANPDRAGDGPGAHAIGVEAEFLGHRLVNLEEYVSSGDELAVSAALTAVAEIGPAGMTLELITKPARLLDGDVDRIPVEESTAALDGVLNRLAAMTGPTPLSTIFPSPEYRLSSDADGVRVEPPSGPGDVAVSPHYSAGTAVAGLADLLTWLSNRPAAVDVFPARAARLHLADGLDLGRRLAEEMATDPAFAGRAPHTWAATRAAVHGTVAALYLQFAAMSQHLHANAGVSLTKNFSAFNLRHFPDHVVEGTGPEGAAWLRRHSATVMDRFASTFRALDTRGERGDPDPGLLDRRLPPRWNRDTERSTATLRDWLYGGFGDDPRRRRVGPDEALGIHTVLPELDRNRAADGTPRLDPPAAVGEMRQEGPRSLHVGGSPFAGRQDVLTGIREIGAASRNAYTAAEALLVHETIEATPFAAPGTWARAVRGESLGAGVAAHETWRGRPTVSPGTDSTRVPAAVAEVENAFGAPLAPVGDGPAAFTTVVDRVRHAGHGADAIVHAYPAAADPRRSYGRDEWVGPVRRVWNLVNHEGTVWIVDPRTGTAAVAGPDSIPRTGRVFAVAADPDAAPIRFAPDDASGAAASSPGAGARPETGPPGDGPDTTTGLPAPTRSWRPGPLWHTDGTAAAAPQLPDPLLPAQWEARRGDAPSGTAHTELVRVLQQPDGTLTPQGNPVTVDVRRIEVEPGRWVRELPLPLHLVGDPAHVARATELAAQALREHVDSRYELPGGDQLHLRIEPSTRADANRVLVTSEPDYTGANSTSLHWRLEHLERGDDPALAVGRTFHELLHRVGLPDRYRVPGAVLGGAVDAAGVMGTDWRSTLLTDADLARIDQVARQAPTHDLPLPGSRSAAPPVAGSPAPRRGPDGGPIAPDSFDWGPVPSGDRDSTPGSERPYDSDSAYDPGTPHGADDAARLTVAFEEGDHRVDPTGRVAVQAATDRWIDDVVAARNEGRPTPALTVTGHGNGSRSASRAWADRTAAERTGLDRARAVEAIARARLRARIADGGTDGLAERDFRIVATGTVRPPSPGASPAEHRVAVLGHDTSDVTAVDSVHDVPFRSGATRLDAAARRELQSIAEQARERARLARVLGLPPPRVQLVGDGIGHHADRLLGALRRQLGDADTDRAGRPRDDVAHRRATGHARATAAAVYLRGLLADVEGGVRVTARSAVDAPDGVVPPPSRGVQALVDQPVRRTVMGDPQGRHLADVPRRVHVPLLNGRLDSRSLRSLAAWAQRTGDPADVHVWTDAGRLTETARVSLDRRGFTVRDVATEFPAGTRASDRILSRLLTDDLDRAGADVAVAVLHRDGGIWAEPGVLPDTLEPLPEVMPLMPRGLTDGEPLFPLLTRPDDGSGTPPTGLMVAPPGSPFLGALLDSPRLAEDGFVAGRLHGYLETRGLVDLDAPRDPNAVRALRDDLESGRYRFDDDVLAPWTGPDPAPRRGDGPAGTGPATRTGGPGPDRLLRVRTVGADQRRAVAELIDEMVPGRHRRRERAVAEQLDEMLRARPEALHSGLPFDVRVGGRVFEAVVAIDQDPTRPGPARSAAPTPRPRPTAPSRSAGAPPPTSRASPTPPACRSRWSAPADPSPASVAAGSPSAAATPCTTAHARP